MLSKWFSTSVQRWLFLLIFLSWATLCWDRITTGMFAKVSLLPLLVGWIFYLSSSQLSHPYTKEQEENMLHVDSEMVGLHKLIMWCYLTSYHKRFRKTRASRSISQWITSHPHVIFEGVFCRYGWASSPKSISRTCGRDVPAASVGASAVVSVAVPPPSNPSVPQHQINNASFTQCSRPCLFSALTIRNLLGQPTSSTGMA